MRAGPLNPYRVLAHLVDLGAEVASAGEFRRLVLVEGPAPVRDSMPVCGRGLSGSRVDRLAPSRISCWPETSHHSEPRNRSVYEPTYRATASRARSLTERPSFLARFCAAR